MKAIVQYLLIFSIVLLFAETAIAQSDNYQFGAYYFDGWTGKYPYHITKNLIDSFPDRKPKWGWVTSTQRIVDEQIKLASDAGLTFFSFCWYYTGENSYKTEPLNQALSLYIKSEHKNNLKFNLLIANHPDYNIRLTDWNVVSYAWIKYFKNKSYFNIRGKPLIIFFSVPSLIKDLGSIENVKNALDSLRMLAIKSGLKGVEIAACVAPNQKSIQEAEACNFDVLTGYNYHGSVMADDSIKERIPIAGLPLSESKVWDKIVKLSKLKYVPAITLNWDPRPWAGPTNHYKTDPYYTGYSPESVFASVSHVKKWIFRNNKMCLSDKLSMIYAWNEYGEGAYLTPTANGVNYLENLKKAIR